MVKRDYCEQLYAYRFDNQEEMDKFLETYNLPRQDHDEIENLFRQIMSKEIKSVITYFPSKKKKKAQNQMVSLMNSIKYLKKNLKPQNFPKNWTGGSTLKLIV